MTGLQPTALLVLRTVGRVLVSPQPPRATGGYGLACRGGLVLLFLIGVALSIPFRPVGLAVMIVASLALLQFLVLQYQGALPRLATVAWLTAVTTVLGAVIGVMWSRWSDADGVAGDVMVLAALAATLAVLPLVRLLFRFIFGPHHPESALAEPHDPIPMWFWIGRVGPDTATIVVRLADEVAADAVTVEYQTRQGSGQSVAVAINRHRLARIPLDGLGPDQLHHLEVQARHGDQVVATARGSFTTFPPTDVPSAFRLAFASCMSTGSKGGVFDTIDQMTPRPRLFMVTGDLHYENLTSDRPDRFLEAYDKVHRSAPLRRIYRSIPMAYVWDDHDYGDNDSDHRSRSKTAAQTAYRMAVPSYVDPDGTGAIHQEFSVGRVRVVVTDNRSERGETPGHLISPDAERWLVDRIIDPAWPVVIWVSPTPWISADDQSDNWGAYAEQRARIAEAVGGRANNLIMVSGDAHMVAIDDGTNSAYGGPGSGFPVLHAAALDRAGSVKGGKFSHGKFPGSGQFGIIDIDDPGPGGDDRITVALSGRSWTGSEIIGHQFTVAVGAGRADRPTDRSTNHRHSNHQDVTT